MTHAPWALGPMTPPPPWCCAGEWQRLGRLGCMKRCSGRRACSGGIELAINESSGNDVGGNFCSSDRSRAHNAIACRRALFARCPRCGRHLPPQTEFSEAAAARRRATSDDRAIRAESLGALSARRLTPAPDFGRLSGMSSMSSGTMPPLQHSLGGRSAGVKKQDGLL